MVKIYPFREIRYNPKKIDSLARVICPPYDVISPEEQKFYYTLHPANIIRLELPQGESRKKYLRAKETYLSWLNKQILVTESQPAFYIYQQDFLYQNKKSSRVGFFAALKLEPWGKNIFPHEKTFPKPKFDRLELLRNLKANISPIFVLFSDRRRKVSSFLSRFCREEKPFIEFKDLEGMKHQIWRVTKEKEILYLQKNFLNKKLYIADGHHRYETALAYSKEQRAESRERRAESEERPSANCILTFLCSLEEEGLLMLPTYRVITGRWRVPTRRSRGVGGGGRKWEEWKKEKEKYFSFTPLKDKKELFPRLKKNLALYSQRKFYLLQLKKEGKEVLKKLLPQSSQAYRHLPLTALDQLILEATKKEDLIFTQDFEEAVKLVDEGTGKIAFFFSSPKAEILKIVAKTGEIMPEKSTYFYPKIPTGLVIYSLRGRRLPQMKIPDYRG